MQRRFLNWVALVAVGLAGVVALSAATALAGRAAASPFELAFEGRAEAVDGDVFGGWRTVGTFTSGGPFCESGTAVDAPHPHDVLMLYTCADGSGSLTLRIGSDQRSESGWVIGGSQSRWTIGEGSGRYAGLRGKGTSSTETLDGDDPFALVVPFRATFQGVADADAVAPSLAFTSTSATKLRGAGGWYTIRVALSLRDDVEGNPVAYKLRLKEGPEHPRDRRLFDLDSTEGTTASGSLSTTFRVLPSSKRVRTIQLLLSGSDPVGNEVSITRSVKLPR
jgi:hypothetical protein